MEFGQGLKNPVYKAWRDHAKDLMIARNYVPGARAGIYPDANLQAIVGDMRRLRPACEELATALSANNLARIENNDEAVVHLVKDYVTKLFNTIKTQGPAAAQGQPGVPFAQVIVPGILLSTNIPAQWGLATAVPNVALVPQNCSSGPRSFCSTLEQPSASTTYSSSSSSTWKQSSASTTFSSFSSSSPA